jgi:hypothetical protein
VTACQVQRNGPSGPFCGAPIARPMAAIQMAGQATPWRRAAEGSGEPTTGRAPGTGPLFFLGTHQAAWLWDERAACHLFVSHRRWTPAASPSCRSPAGG